MLKVTTARQDNDKAPNTQTGKTMIQNIEDPWGAETNRGGHCQRRFWSLPTISPEATPALHTCALPRV